MQLEKNGKLIKDVKFKKKKIAIIFSDETKIEISQNTFAHFYLYKGKEVSEDELIQIEEEDQLSSLKAYTLNILSRTMYSQKEIEDKLIKKGISKKIIEKITKYLKEFNFINDEKYCSLLVEEYTNKNYGKERIIQNLMKKGIDEKILSNISFEEDEEEEKAKKLVKRYCLNNKNKSFQKIKDSCYAFLLNKGFSYSLASKVIKDVEQYVYKEDDIEILKSKFEKYVILHQIDLLDQKQKEKTIRHFINQGFSYEDIKSQIKEETWKS